MGKLYLVATPIGNLADITLRAIETLKNADLILAEDTRTTGNLLKHYQIPQKPMLSFFEGNEERRIVEVLAKLQQGVNIALVSESGTPLISDPGFKLVREAIKFGITVEAIPGPTALITALVVSGLPTNAFLFLGFLPKKEGKARNVLADVRLGMEHMKQVKTVIFYESPHRLIKSLKLIKEIFSEVDIVVARELSKLYEEIKRAKVTNAIDYFQEKPLRGEFVIVFTI